ncbi:hypothetical protein QOZ80_5BG0433050 [Eleusine coracana subsp. coracana]|nr:hypothetical protein QOZ80_5BG0433050 [Eleusine coracana subsp. coracana]
MLEHDHGQLLLPAIRAIRARLCPGASPEAGLEVASGTAVATRSVGAAGHRRHAPPRERPTAPSAAGPGSQARPAHDAAARPDAACGGVVQGDGPRRAHDPWTARAVLMTHDANFTTRPKLLAGRIVVYEWADIIFAPSTDYWRKLRQLCTSEILGPQRVLSFRHIREDEVMLRVEEIRAMGPSTPVNLSVMFHSMSNNIVSRAAFGNKPKNAPEFIAATKVLISLVSGFNIPDLFPAWTTVLARFTGMTRRLKDIHKTMDTILEEIIHERMATRDSKIKSGADVVDENLLDVFIGLQEKGGLGFDLTNSIIKAVILDIFAGGTGTPASAMEWAMSELMRNPETMKKLHGYTIPAKSRVIINAWAIGRDSLYWKDAEEFRPERFEDGAIYFNGNNYEFLPFGSGRRMCPGFNYGLTSMELTFAGLLYHFDWSLPEGVKEVDMEEAPGLGVRRRSPLILCATPFVRATTTAC